MPLDVCLKIVEICVWCPDTKSNFLTSGVPMVDPRASENVQVWDRARTTEIDSIQPDRWQSMPHWIPSSKSCKMPR